MIKLNDRAWGSFRLDELFDIKCGDRLRKSDMIIGDNIFIGAIDGNNGMSARIGQSPKHNGNTITVNYDGSGVAESFYQELPFWASDSVNVLYPKFNMTRFNALFLTSIIKKEKFKFSYGRKWNASRMSASQILLPVAIDGNPDWQFMEDYIKQFEETKLLEIQETDYKENVKLPNVDEWASFRLDELFTLKKGFYGKKPNNDNVVCKRNIPLVSTSSLNNGILNKYTSDDIYNYDYFGKLNYSTEGKIINGGVMTIASDGSVGSTFYQEVPFSSTHIVIICEPLFEINKYIGLFIKNIIEKEKFRFGYGRKWALSRMSQSVIKLPALENGEPDWILIERYMRSLPYSEMI